MNDVKRIRQGVTDSYNANQRAQYETSKVAYIKSYYQAYGTNSDAPAALPQIYEYLLDAELEDGDFKRYKSFNGPRPKAQTH